MLTYLEMQRTYFSITLCLTLYVCNAELTHYMSVDSILYNYAHLKCNVGIIMHSKYLWLITEWQALHVVPISLDTVGIG